MITNETLFNLNQSLKSPVYTGGIARNYYLSKDSNSVYLNSDIDVVIQNKDEILPIIKDHFFISHFHPNRGPGKLILQLADKTDFSRIDVFLGKHHETEDVIMNYQDTVIQLLSLSEIFCNTLISLKPLFNNQCVDTKYFNYLMQLWDKFNQSELELYWKDYYHHFNYESLSKTVGGIISSFKERRDLFITPSYESDIHKTCPHCIYEEKYPLIDKRLLFDHWGFV